MNCIPNEKFILALSPDQYLLSMEKDFDFWNDKKKDLNIREGEVFFHEREIWWCSLGVNIGFEQDGTGKNFDRPVMVLKKFNNQVFLSLPLTGKKKEGKYYSYLGKVEGRDATAILSQLRLVDAKRLIRKVMTVDSGVFITIQDRLKGMLFG